MVREREGRTNRRCPPASKKFGDVETLSLSLNQSLPYQLDQVLELIRLRVEIVDQKGLELLCGGGWLVGEVARRRERERERERARVRTKNPSSSCRVCPVEIKSTPDTLSPSRVPRSSGYLSRGGMALPFGRLLRLGWERASESESESERREEREEKRKRVPPKKKVIESSRVPIFHFIVVVVAEKAGKRRRRTERNQSSWLSSSS